MKNFVLVATVALITEKLSFSFFYGSHCKENKFLHQNIQLIKPNYLRKNETDKELSRKIVMNVYPLPHYDDIDPSNNVKMLQKLIF